MSENLWFSDVSGGKEIERWAKTGWRSNEIVTENYFCARHKNRWKPALWTAIFHDKFTIWYIKLTIYTEQSKFIFHERYLFGLLFSGNRKKTHTKRSVLQLVYILTENQRLKNLQKYSNCKQPFLKRKCYWYNLLR